VTGYAVVSVRLRRPVDQTTPRLTESHLPALFVGQQSASILYLGGCQSSFGREQLSSRGIIFKGE